MLTGAGDLQDYLGEPLPAGESVVRAVVSWHDPPGRWVNIAAYAQEHGYKFELGIQWGSNRSDGQLAYRVNQVLTTYEPYQPWAIALGNEQSLAWDGGSQDWQQYDDSWQVAEPLVAARMPWALRVGGEIVPWVWQDLAQSLAHRGLPGVQAIAGHFYPNAHGALAVQFAQLAAAYHLPAIADEGMAGPNEWDQWGAGQAGGPGAFPASYFRALGFMAALTWCQGVSGAQTAGTSRTPATTS